MTNRWGIWCGLLMLVMAPLTATATADGCAVVLKTPDGFLALRKAPTANAEIVARLKEGEKLDVDTAQCETRADLSICGKGTRWTHVTSIPRLDGKQSATPTRGWVSDRYIKWFPCE
ncbi:SH3 domain-containing protein [Bradyrhizobium sp. 170]|uniref:SH3 domain-containing protein n=1 Tax=Bradyrhizobium sp. 170 TaxID=2782641 RepID=UPI001FFEC616|nr:SH3 domain-containing protein [Bradyrhizobium sp. 170]UPK03075.1 SH3 domain-containing protein [Bradyrhizobium sp. 170]